MLDSTGVEGGNFGFKPPVGRGKMTGAPDTRNEWPRRFVMADGGSNNVNFGIGGLQHASGVS